MKPACFDYVAPATAREAVSSLKEYDGDAKLLAGGQSLMPLLNMRLARPGLIILAIFTFMGSYGSFFWPLVTIRDEHLYTLPVGMLYFDSTQGRGTELIMAATVINILPMMILFIAMQKYLVKGIQLGAVKG